MPKFFARLEATDGSGHFRTITITSPSEEEARAAIMRREYRLAGFQLPADQLADFEAKEKAAAEADVVAPPDVRSGLAVHRQQAPYELVWFGSQPRPERPAAAKKQRRGGS